MISDKEGFLYPHVDKAKCIDCGRCKQVCPTKKESILDDQNEYFGVKAKDETTRLSGSSGGVFPILAEFVLSRQGIVYGAGYDEHMYVLHQGIKTLEQLQRIKKTKYVQSNMVGIYCNIEHHLMKGRWVLFCGTPCQAYALRLFLKYDYDKLIITDLVCYGVPSPGIWKNYVEHLEHVHQGKLSDFSFRDKRNQDNGHMCSYRIDGKEYAKSLYSDVYCKMFFKGNSVRRSCFKCKFCTVKRSSDFTIGDFWGIEKVRPDLNDGMGISMMITHTDMAKKVWDMIKEKTIFFQCSKDELLQPRLIEPTAIGKKRFELMVMYRVLPFSLFIKWLEKFN